MCVIFGDINLNTSGYRAGNNLLPTEAEELALLIIF